MSQTNRKDGGAEEILEKGLIAAGIIVASTLAGPVWATLTINAPTYNQDLQATLFGFLVGVILVLTTLLQRRNNSFNVLAFCRVLLGPFVAAVGRELPMATVRDGLAG